ncbi:MAG: hypothetical protein COU07_00645 [Candidatus Harrisonbacteria bacterium CG10_big_fil_rev_8_21_14_0_10_40_38]|uniref:Uncharacterized protein n=1 Tax=Candidatus Harrisonbacteria bacterium CG10_big_fil_rev_8_21_14_0_10_40_38 TaxID=1974583 RepID=A0A2H0USN9_9BACT|nr:MAG: hypothetical protein COU07_00645 [Candidatus Harrisonbacteria bacterium CG10_big_fil_rev_8_21_14_0_10_40_38]
MEESGTVVKQGETTILTNERMTVLNNRIDPTRLFDEQVERLRGADIHIPDKDIRFLRQKLFPGLFLLVPPRPDVVNGKVAKSLMNKVTRGEANGTSTLPETSEHKSYSSTVSPTTYNKAYILVDVLDGRTLKGNTVTHDLEKLNDQERCPFDIWEGLIAAISIFHASLHNLCFAGTTLHDNCVPVLSTDIISRQATLFSREMSSTEEKRGTPSYRWRLYAGR